MFLQGLLALAVLLLAPHAARAAVTPLADQPFITTVSVPGNVALALSVEYPTATSIGNGIVNYSSAKTYYGIFDATRCYVYTQVMTKTTAPYYGSYFSPAALASTSDRSCANAATLHLWSGNFLNWAAMSTIDPFRWALTGGYRAVDTPTLTVLEKAWAPPSQGSPTESPIQITSQASYPNVTPTGWTSITTTVFDLGQYMCFTGTGPTSTGNATVGNPAATYSNSASNVSGSISNATEFSSSLSLNPASPYCVEVRVQVCNPAAPTGVEGNCTMYSAVDYKPEGLIQKYANQMRFADFGYLLDSASQIRDGGVMRARMKFVGPLQPVVGSTAINNPNAEWSASTGVFVADPDTADSGATRTAAGCNGSLCTISNSGVINYLNMFGEHARTLGHTAGYKSGDNVSELYYTVLRYFKELGNVPEYTALTAINSALNASDCVTKGADQCVDGFPVITNWYPADTSAPRGYDYPIQYACQKNFIVGIGDENTHQDENLPGTSGRGGAYLADASATANSSDEPPLETLVSSTGGVACTASSPTPCSDTTVDTTAVTNWVGNQEGTINGKSVSSTGQLGQVGQRAYLSCCGTAISGSAFYIAGLAYDAHVKDLVPNAFQASNGSKTQIQTLSTYWVDVLEYGTFQNNNQYWLATKYGGFSVPSGYTEYAVPSVNGTNWAQSLWAANARTVANGATNYVVPDNYFSGRDSAAMVSGLSSAFAQISASVKATTTALSLSIPQVTCNGNTSYSAAYDSSSWTSDLVASTLSFSNSGTPSLVQVWDGRNNLDNQVSTNGFIAGRKIVTWNATVSDTGTGSAVPFEATLVGGVLSTQLSTKEQNDLAPSTGTASLVQVVSYLRGDRSNEGVSGAGLFRARSYLLGDIVDSRAVPVGRPDAPMIAEHNLGYGVFKSTYAARSPVVYAGANDGMLHAFDGSQSSSTAGQELWAYIPGALYDGPSATPAVNGLASRTYKNFTHYNFVDATPVVGDVDFDNGGTTHLGTASDWHTILVGGLGKGGMSYYAIDITDPTTMTSESAIAGKVLWEFNQKTISNSAYGGTATIGYSFGPPIITKTAKYGWVVILTSGYDNTLGLGYFFFVDPKTGLLLEPPLSTGAGSAGTPSGLAFATTFVPDYTDGTSDALYAGDLLGNLWRVDLTPTTGNYAAPVKLASVADPGGTAQPITTWPIVEISATVAKRYVLFGTGKTLAASDLANTQINSIYSIYDGTASSGGFFTSTSPTLPTGTTYPIKRNELQAVTTLLTGTGSTPTAAMGWYYDLGTCATYGQPACTSAPYIAEQVDINPVANAGYAAFGVNLSNGSACSPSGTGRIVAFEVGSGITALTDGSGNAVAFSQLSNRVEDLAFTNLNGSSINLTGGTDYSPTQLVNPNFSPPFANGSTKLNWREVKGAN